MWRIPVVAESCRTDHFSACAGGCSNFKAAGCCAGAPRDSPHSPHLAMNLAAVAAGAAVAGAAVSSTAPVPTIGTVIRTRAGYYVHRRATKANLGKCFPIALLLRLSVRSQVGTRLPHPK